MTEPPTWTILIPTLGQRGPLLVRMLDVLLPQLDEFGGRARVLAWFNNGKPALAHIRQGLVEAVTTEYMSFVDDDDLVPDYFVAEFLRALESRPDKVGYQIQYYANGVPQAIVDHSLRHGRWYQDRAGLYRDVTHVDPMRTELARRADFRRGTRPGKAEDRVWVNQVRPHLRTEVYIPRVMYHYLWRADTTAWQHPGKIASGFPRPVIDHPYFAWHPGSADA